MAALARIERDGGDGDLISSGHVQNLEVEEGGGVRFGFILSPGDQGDLVKEARAAAESVPGVTTVKVNVQLPQMTPAGGGGRQGGLQPGSVPAPTPKPNILADVRHVVAVSSGKGGVGKSMVAANLAAALDVATRGCSNSRRGWPHPNLKMRATKLVPGAMRHNS